MTLQSRLQWLTTSQGRQIVRILSTAVCFGTFAVQYLPQTIFLDKYHDLVTMRKNGQPFAISASMRKVFDKVLDDLKFHEMHRKLMKPFTVFGYDVWHAGSLNSKFGALIGVPVNFIYEKVSMIDKNRIVINNDHVNWSRKEAKDLLESLILTENAKKYGIARETCLVNNYSVLIQPTTSSFLLCTVYILTASFNTKYEMFTKPRQVRILLYGILSTFVWGIWAMQKDAYTRYYEYCADEKISKLGLAYIKGGLEYYDKMMKRNIALRELSGSNGEKTFTKGGNEQILFREKHIPYTHRKLFFEQKLKEYEEQSLLQTVVHEDIAVHKDDAVA